jgi:hypothetical protein
MTTALLTEMLGSTYKERAYVLIPLFVDINEGVTLIVGYIRNMQKL